MERKGFEVHITTEEARGGIGLNVVRWVLAISLLLAIGALSIIWITGADHAPQPARDSIISGQAAPTG